MQINPEKDISAKNDPIRDSSIKDDSTKQDLPEITPIEQLSLAHNFIFGEVMRQEDICKLFLESLLGKKIARIEYITKEKDLTIAYGYHGIRLDIYLADENQTRYCVEMQQSPHKSLPRRIRYYQGGIDRDFLEQGRGYDNLPESYIIFICDYDPFGARMACYERIYSFKGVEQTVYRDGSHVFILNTHYNPEKVNVSKGIQEYLDYIREKDDQKPLNTKLGRLAKEKVTNVKQDNTIRSKYMQTEVMLYDKLKEGRAEGRKEGRAEGRMEGRAEGLREGIARGQQNLIAKMAESLSPEQIAKILKMPLDSIKKTLAA